MANQSGENPLSAFSNALTAAVERAGLSTVMVNARHRFPASGVVYEQGLILTANHVVEREEDITVGLADGNEVNAHLAGRDPGTDLAVLRIDQAAGTPGERASQEARVGQVVLALGRPLADSLQASLGVVSAVGGPVRFEWGGRRRGPRESPAPGTLERFLRTDVTPYPGFSGGPLVDIEGRILGINTTGFISGVALTIPTIQAWQVADALAKSGRVKRGYLGIRSQTVELPQDVRSKLGREQPTGLLIVGIEPGSSAAAGGLMVGDILVAVGGHPVEDHDMLFAQLGPDVVGNAVEFELLRGGERKTITLTVGERQG